MTDMEEATRKRKVEEMTDASQEAQPAHKAPKTESLPENQVARKEEPDKEVVVVEKEEIS